MDKIIGVCGITCTDCPAYKATHSDDDAERKRVAEMWSKEFKAEIKPEDINCHGCLSNGEKLIAYCQSCKIRKCCRDKGLDNCATCDEQPCEILLKFHEFSPDAKAQFNSLVKRVKLI